MKFVISSEKSYYDRIEYDPHNAIIGWCLMQETSPMGVSIQADSEESAYALLVWARENFDLLRTYMREHKCPYKPEYMKEVIEKYVKRKNSSMQWAYDQVSPFDIG